MPELSKTYTSNEVEERWYAQWLERGCFTADPARVSDKRPAYSIVIPPPNVTGILTLGHVLNNTIQDILARRARMLGKEVLWLPGTDHAGIATQNVVEKTLKKDGSIKHRDDLGREKMVEKIWEWKEKFGGIILKQLRALGASCDWSRTRFTMDEEYSKCVTKVFVDLYQKGLIYRGKRMVNWCPSALTALSDEEVEMRQQNGHLYYFKVEVVEEPGTWLTIATTRPETIPGDTAIAVSPKDERYAHLIGKHVRRPLPLENQAGIPIVADDHIDPQFGTGVLKVTPAHDKADFEIGQRHNLPQIDIMNPNASMNELAGKDLQGLDRFEARKKAVELLREMGDLVKEEPYQNNVGYSERAGVPIEPRLSEQWFLKYPSVPASQAVVAEGRMRFFPDRWAKVYDHWMGGIQDWCISRQIWWGHRVPVWYRDGEVYCGETAPEGDGWTQDADVLDTWFSSWLWPFATMGWPKETNDLKAFYPTTDLVTGPDIIFFWVARMIMAGYEWMGEMPFKNVYFTGIIRDKQGRKMSKSLGNSPDPLELISKFGADALRFGIMRSAPLGADVLFDEKNVELGRNFCTKLWNAARFRQMQGGASEGEIKPELLSSDDKWILARLSDAIQEVSTALEEYRFSDAAATLYRFFWSEYCDWYVEATKAVLNGSDEARKANTLAVMDFVLGHTLRLFHPFLPFITEELWQGMGFNKEMPADQGGDTIMFAPWPKSFDEAERTYFGITAEEEKFAAAKQEVVNLGRGLKSGANIASNKRVRFVLKPASELAAHEVEVVKILLNAETLDLDPAYAAPKGTPVVLTPFGELFLPLEGLIDVAAERERVKKEIAKVEVELEKVRAKLADENFTSKVPAKVLDDHRQRETDWAAKLGQLQKMAEGLQ
ncbi:valine--tRNA ligase [Verrucomicrobium sp. BvORR034]|uniref:valine--tRNA ligase n=1 Tax=Verrucomicrobium sp. BvORR034 TaxID=1396418 RepID=UPI000678A845|nr:valine--tRNA ligase [Verrucomicrobium sp. BvORR034]